MDIRSKQWMKITSVLILSVVLSSNVLAENQRNKTAVGMHIGDPMALTLRLPVAEKNFVNISGGIWAWHFWHDVRYDTAILSVDFAWLFGRKNSRWTYSAGFGLNIFFGDNPKDSQDYEACLGIRFPLGVEYFVSDRISIGLEYAPFFQILPPFAFTPYVIDQNGGIVIRFFL